MHFKIELITPEKAEEYLATNAENQRGVKTVWVSQIAGMMDAGIFNGLNGETLKFSKIGGKWVLVDGQHRLMAIIKHGKPVEMAVLRGVDASSFITLDQGYTRTVENYYQIANQGHAKVCSQVAKWLFYEQYGGNPLNWHGAAKDRPLPGLIAKWGIENHPDLPQVLEGIGDLLNLFQKKNLGTKNHLAFCYYQWQKVDPILAHDIAKYLSTGIGDVCSTVRSLREYLIEEARKDTLSSLPGTKRGAKVINALMKGWNLVRAKKKNIQQFSRVVSDFQKELDSKVQGFDVVPEKIAA